MSSHIPSKALYFEIYLASPLIVDGSVGLHFPITTAYILFLFYYMFSSMSRYFFIFIHLIFCLEGLIYSSFFKSLGLWIFLKAIVRSSKLYAMHTISSSCMTFFKIESLNFSRNLSQVNHFQFFFNRHNITSISGVSPTNFVALYILLFFSCFLLLLWFLWVFSWTFSVSQVTLSLSFICWVLCLILATLLLLRIMVFLIVFFVKVLFFLYNFFTFS